MILQKDGKPSVMENHLLKEILWFCLQITFTSFQSHQKGKPKKWSTDNNGNN